MSEESDRAIADGIARIAEEAGRAIMAIYARDFDVEVKADSSPVTEADQVAEGIILKGLRALTPDIPIVAEEEVAAGRVPDISGGAFWLVDPLDGTREFINRNDEFTVNIALIRDGRPVLGVVHIPALNETFLAAGPGAVTLKRGNAEPQPIAARGAPAEGMTVMVSRSHLSPETEDFLQDFTVHERKDAGSSLKFCRLAEGAADLYPRLGRTMEWDTAAGHAVLACAGGRVDRLDGTPLTYGKAEFENPHFVARGQD